MTATSLLSFLYLRLQDPMYYPLWLKVTFNNSLYLLLNTYQVYKNPQGTWGTAHLHKSVCYKLIVCVCPTPFYHINKTTITHIQLGNRNETDVKAFNTTFKLIFNQLKLCCISVGSIASASKINPDWVLNFS